MTSISSPIMDYNKIIKATATLQQFAEQPRRMNFLHPNDPVHSQLMNLMTDIREFMNEQRRFNEKVEKFIEARKSMDETQRAVNAFVFEKISKCKCIEDPSELILVPCKEEKQDEIIEQLKEDSNTPSPQIPCTSTSFTVYPTTVQPIIPHPNQDLQIDVELLKMSQNTQDSPQHESDLTELFLENRCGTSFDNNFDSLSEERRLRSKGPYKCTECEKEFKQKHGLQQHLLTHSIGSFFCDICGKRYTRQESVNRHKRTTQCNRNQIHEDQNKPNTNNTFHHLNQKIPVFSHQQSFLH